MRCTEFLISIKEAENDFHKALERLIQHSDACQWYSAGIELGTVRQLAKKMEDTTRFLESALWEDSQNYTKEEK